MSKRRREIERARGRQKAAAPPRYESRMEASLLTLSRILFLYLHRVHTGKSVESVAASYGIEQEGLRERFDYMHGTLDDMLPPGRTLHKRINKFCASRRRRLGESARVPAAAERAEGPA